MSSKIEGSSKRKPPRAGMGRPAGVPNKTTALLKDAILQAAELAGGEDGLVGYLTAQAKDEPVAFMGMLGKVLPLQLTGDGGGPLTAIFKTVYENRDGD